MSPGRTISRRRLIAGTAALAGVFAAGGAAAIRFLGGGDSPQADGNGNQRTPSPGSTGTPSASVTPGGGLVQPSSGDWVKETLGPGVAIPSNPLVCFMDPTGEVTTYRFGPVNTALGIEYHISRNNRWLSAQAAEGAGLADRDTGDEFRWDGDTLVDHFLGDSRFVFSAARPPQQPGRTWPPDATNPYYLTDTSLAVLAEFEAPELPDRYPQRLWAELPGGTLLLADRNGVYAIDASGIVTRRYEVPAKDGYAARLRHAFSLANGDVVFDYDFNPGYRYSDTGDQVPTGVEGESIIHLAVFDWGEGPPRVSEWTIGRNTWAVFMSPDGRHVAYEQSMHDGAYGMEANDIWPMLVVADADTGEPLCRVRSAKLGTGDFLWSNRWLADSRGVVAATVVPTTEPQLYTDLSFAIFTVNGESIPLPRPPGYGESWFRGSDTYAPVPSPADPDLFSYGRIALHNVASGEWFAPEMADGPMHLEPWGGPASGREMRFAFPHGGHGGAPPGVFLPAKVEFPPFDGTLRVVVGRTGDCLNLREYPSLKAPILDCMVDGEVLLLEPFAGASGQPSAANPIENALAHLNWEERRTYAHVRNELGALGWVAIEYLDWA